MIPGNKRMVPLLTAVLIAVAVTAGAQAESLELVIEAARDTTQGFAARDLERQSRRLLAWPEGVVSLPDSVVWREGGATGLAFRLDSAKIAGGSAAGLMRLVPGRYDLDTPVYLGDGTISAMFSAGRLEVTPGRILYRRPASRIASRGTLFLLAGLVLATGVMLRAARRRTRRS